MNLDTPAIRPPLERFPTTVAGLDVILKGGLFRGGVYMIQGVPGAGKTILANQISFGSIAAGGKVVYLTLLAESHTRLIQQLQTLDFFDRTAIPDRIYYISAFRQLQTGGLDGVLSTAQQEVASHAATVLVIDGLSVAAEAAQSAQEMKRLVHDLQALAAMQGCTIFLLTSGDGTLTRAEDTMVDGRIFLEADLLGPQPERRISIMKSRGDAALIGSHSFVIDQSGIRVFPRLESVFKDPPATHEGVAATGLRFLDHLFESKGLPVGSCTILQGPSGGGKTSLGLHFLDESRPEASGLGICFFEPPDMLLRKADGFGLGLRAKVLSGAVDLAWHAPADYLLDELGYAILAKVDERKVARLVIDDVSGIFGAVGYGRREHRFLACLFNETSRRGVTTLVMHETREDGSSAGHASAGPALTTFADNVIDAHFGYREGKTQRSLSIRKARYSSFESRPVVYAISRTGISTEGLKPSGKGAA
jgi:circadian clock protein KaiC